MMACWPALKRRSGPGNWRSRRPSGPWRYCRLRGCRWPRRGDRSLLLRCCSGWWRRSHSRCHTRCRTRRWRRSHRRSRRCGRRRRNRRGLRPIHNPILGSWLPISGSSSLRTDLQILSILGHHAQNLLSIKRTLCLTIGTNPIQRLPGSGEGSRSRRGCSRRGSGRRWRHVRCRSHTCSRNRVRIGRSRHMNSLRLERRNIPTMTTSPLDQLVRNKPILHQVIEDFLRRMDTRNGLGIRDIIAFGQSILAPSCVHVNGIRLHANWLLIRSHTAEVKRGALHARIIEDAGLDARRSRESSS